MAKAIILLAIPEHSDFKTYFHLKQNVSFHYVPVLFCILNILLVLFLYKTIIFIFILNKQNTCCESNILEN